MQIKMCIRDSPQHPYTQALLSAIPIPDPDVEQERDAKKIRLEGDVPSPINTPPGCKFKGRCKYRTEACDQAVSYTHLDVYKRQHLVKG